ncbi:MAG: putative porin [Tenacibaculum sp.]|nr:putative porin [Tenacibaculum sp.]
MKKLFFLLFVLLFSNHLFSQIRGLGRDMRNLGGNVEQRDSINNDEISVKLNGKTRYTDYKVINYKNDTTHIDTTLTIKKEYKFNFRRKDNFELLPFHNQGQTFNNLAYNYNKISLLPDIGFKTKRFYFTPINEVNYYEVSTPTSEIMYRTGMEQGQVLNALFTVNFSRRFNVSLSYKGLRSLGHYRRSLVSYGNFIGTFNYRTPKERYSIKGHLSKQDATNQENGGLTQISLKNFISDEKKFSKRGRLDVNLNDTENKFNAMRFYLNHNYKLFSVKDTTNTKNFSNLKLGHIFSYQEKEYIFNQKTATPSFLGEGTSTGENNEITNYKLIDNQVYLEFNSKYVLGRFKVKANYSNISYGYNRLLNANSLIDNQKLKGNAVYFGVDWRGKIGNFEVNADATVIPGSGHLSGQYYNGDISYKKDDLFTVKGGLLINSKKPNFNFQLFQSSYNEYNWNNTFKNIGTRNINFSFLSKWGNATLDFTNIEDYVYFNQNNKPKQYDKPVTYLKLKVNKEFRLGKFALDNTVMYQKVANGKSVFRVPEIVTRNTLYYTDEWFKGKPLLVQIGATFKYFTKYNANAYNPLLAEFTLQDNTKIGFPTLDLFFNCRVRRTRIYFKLDNVTSKWAKKNYFSAPNYPYRDMTIRFGLVWNWFI